MIRFRHIAVAVLALAASVGSASAHVPRDVLKSPRSAPLISVNQCSSVVVSYDHENRLVSALSASPPATLARSDRGLGLRETFSYQG